MTQLRLVRLNELGGYADKELLPCVRGRISMVGKVYSGEGSRGPYHLQEIKIEGDGTSVYVKLDGQPEIPKSWKGREIEITYHQGEKGLSGVYAMDDDYQDKITRKIKVTSTGTVALLEGGGTAPASQPRQEPQQQRHEDTTGQQQRGPEPTQAPATNGGHHAQPQPGSDKDIQDVRRSIMQACNLMLLCQMAVETMIVPTFKTETGKDMDEARKGAMASSLFISAERKGLNNLMPFRKLASTPPQQSPEPPAEQPPAGGYKW